MSRDDAGSGGWPCLAGQPHAGPTRSRPAAPQHREAGESDADTSEYLGVPVVGIGAVPAVVSWGRRRVVCPTTTARMTWTHDVAASRMPLDEKPTTSERREERGERREERAERREQLAARLLPTNPPYAKSPLCGMQHDAPYHDSTQYSQWPGVEPSDLFRVCLTGRWRVLLERPTRVEGAKWHLYKYAVDYILPAHTLVLAGGTDAGEQTNIVRRTSCRQPPWIASLTFSHCSPPPSDQCNMRHRWIKPPP